MKIRLLTRCGCTRELHAVLGPGEHYLVPMLRGVASARYVGAYDDGPGPAAFDYRAFAWYYVDVDGVPVYREEIA